MITKASKELLLVEHFYLLYDLNILFYVLTSNCFLCKVFQIFFIGTIHQYTEF